MNAPFPRGPGEGLQAICGPIPLNLMAAVEVEAEAEVANQNENQGRGEQPHGLAPGRSIFLRF